MILKLAGMVAAIGCAITLGGTASATTYSAISYNKTTGVYGYSKGYSSREGAEERAAQECGPGCETVIWARDACASLATAKDHSYGTAWDMDIEAADNNAIDKCSEFASDCSVVAEACSGE